MKKINLNVYKSDPISKTGSCHSNARAVSGLNTPALFIGMTFTGLNLVDPVLVVIY